MPSRGGGGAPVDGVTVAGAGHHDNDRRQRVRDGGDRRRASSARQRRQLGLFANTLLRNSLTNKLYEFAVEIRQ